MNKLLRILRDLIWREKAEYEADGLGNPCRRFCARCGQCQMYFSTSTSPDNGWWESMYPMGDDPDCACHRDTESTRK